MSPHSCMLLRHGPASVRNLFSRLRWPRGRFKVTTLHKACTLPAVHSSSSKHASHMFRLNSVCNRTLTCSTKRVDLTNRKRLAVYACANRDVLQDFFHHGDIICHPKSSYITTKLNGMSTCGCNNNAICSDKGIFTFPTVDACRPR